ncbi:FGGY-family carbohydrate kinase [Rhizobium sp. SSA_523]|uniref:FGGY-family carbohydrate kinase n=1 Tax=Rhizobium sp. SSA_523 TaxID=2952477 RepID=UPI002090F2E3|nr:FGGY-family carbohydrate kinase [Rhizobium sp. SSA_523]MCO5732434.1 FGGY-family carbohydrate kinase [Rhizobium sp. SSA_523]WKC22423.1 FGGY-family carbohydrate kinase [Rhizobium sp. SSA_523]
MGDLVVAVDVGTTSARAGVFDLSGRLLAKARHPILMVRQSDILAEHSSEDIWQATCLAVRAAMGEADIAAADVKGIGFDATCSLVLRARDGTPLSVSASGGAGLDTIVWFDHRAVAQAEALNATHHPVLRYCGGTISPEMQIPKLMWLKQQMPQCWARIGHAFDLADFMTWRATGSAARSRSTLSAKWNFLAHRNEGWDTDFLAAAGLDDLLERAGLPQSGRAVGDSLGRLTPEAARDLGLCEECLVSPGIIDAYAGALGALGGAAARSGASGDLALIGGTSSCVVSLSSQPVFTNSLWGPFHGALLPDLWLVEGSQSAAGALLDHIVAMHAAGGEPTAARHHEIIERITLLRQEQAFDFGRSLHILPDFHGNRAPLGDPRATGTIAGLTLDRSFDGLCRLYWRTCVALSLGIRQILETMIATGHPVETLHLAGGHVQNSHLVELYADATGFKIRVPAAPDAVLLGTAMAAAAAAGCFTTLADAASAMDQGSRLMLPNPAARRIYDRDYARFRAMQRHRAELAGMDDEAEAVN